MQELSSSEREAVFAYLTRNVEEFRPLAPYEIPLEVRQRSLIAHCALASTVNMGIANFEDPRLIPRNDIAYALATAKQYLDTIC